METPVVIIYGPTAVGKTDFVERLALHLPLEVINGDMGQMYRPLSIGTAKPDMARQVVTHHLFDIIEGPEHFSAYAYRLACDQVIKDIRQRGKVPVIVGGSGFYIRALFYPPHVPETQKDVLQPAQMSLQQSAERSNSLSVTWEQLHEIDPERASQVHPHDTYRIQRAYELWLRHGIKPSHLKPSFNPVANCKFFFLDRQRDDLTLRINQRVVEMFKAGWLDEVRHLGPAWFAFLKTKGLMGYDVISQALELNAFDYERVREEIQAKTRTYARRQRIFWRGLRRCFLEKEVAFTELNLTLFELDLYIKQLSNDFQEDIRKST